MLAVEGSTNNLLHLFLPLPQINLYILDIQDHNLHSIDHSNKDGVAGTLHEDNVRIQCKTIDFLKYFLIAISASVSWIVSIDVNHVGIVHAVVGVKQIDDFRTGQQHWLLRLWLCLWLLFLLEPTKKTRRFFRSSRFWFCWLPISCLWWQLDLPIFSIQ